MRQEANYKEKETVSVRELVKKKKGKNKHLNAESAEWKKSKWKRDKERRSVSHHKKKKTISINCG